MRYCILFLLACSLHAQNLAGRVLNAKTGQPMKDAVLTLKRLPPDAGLFSTKSDSEGKFAFARLDLGQYELRAERNGFVAGVWGASRPWAAGTPVVVSTGPQSQTIEFRLVPHGAISGRVLDGDGEPFPLVQVTLKHAVYIDGRKQIVAVDSRGVGNVGGVTQQYTGIGEFRFFGLAAGRYFLSATALTPETQIGVNRTGGVAPDPYVQTWHSSAIHAEAAKEIVVAAGESVENADIRIARAKRVSLQGRVNNKAGTDVKPTGAYVLVPGPEGPRQIGLGPQGQFGSALFAGSHSIIVVATTAQGHTYLAKSVVDIQQMPVTTEVVFEPVLSLTGSLRGGDGLSGLSVLLTSKDAFPGIPYVAPRSVVAADGGFVFAGVGPGAYRVSVSGVPDGFYVKSMRVGEVDVLANGIDLVQAPSAPLEIVLSSGAGSVEGIVQDTPGAVVVLAGTGSFQTAVAGRDGRFAIRGLVPGNYRAFAWMDVEEGAWTDPEFLRQFEMRGKSVVVREAGRESITLGVLGDP